MSSSSLGEVFNFCMLKYFHLFVFLLFLSFLIALTEIFNIILNKSSEKRHLCLILDIRGNSFTFPHLV